MVALPCSLAQIVWRYGVHGMWPHRSMFLYFVLHGKLTSPLGNLRYLERGSYIAITKEARVDVPKSIIDMNQTSIYLSAM